jgi:CBS-domain-containing membrane protein
MINSAFPHVLWPNVLRSWTIAEIMTPDLLAFDKRMPIQKAAALLRFNELEAAPVVDDLGRLAGVVTLESCAAWEDFSRRSSAHGLRYSYPDLTPVSEIASSAVDRIREDAPASDVLEPLIKRWARRIYVVDSDRKVVGVASMADLVRHFIDGANDLAPAAACALAMR